MTTLRKIHGQLEHVKNTSGNKLHNNASNNVNVLTRVKRSRNKCIVFFVYRGNSRAKAELKLMNKTIMDNFGLLLCMCR